MQRLKGQHNDTTRNKSFLVLLFFKCQMQSNELKQVTARRRVWDYSRIVILRIEDIPFLLRPIPFSDQFVYSTANSNTYSLTPKPE